MGRIVVDPSFLILLLFLFIKSPVKEIFLFLGAVLLHEGGHLIALILCGVYPKKLVLSLSGASLVTHCPYLPYKKEALVFLAGPLAGILGCGAAFLLLRWHFTQGAMLFFSFNLFLTLLNLIPVEGLDGSCALRALFCLYGSETKVEAIVSALHGVSLIFLLGISLWLVERENNASLLILTLALLGESLTKRKKATIYS